MTDQTNSTAREKEFFDREYAAGNRRTVERFHAANEPMHDRFIAWMLEFGAGKKVLQLGCGQDLFSRMLVESGACVTAIDISSTAIEQARTVHADLSPERITFLEMSAEQLDFPDNSFDFVFGSGILHHLVLARALPEIQRVLKPGGTLLFSEPLGMNPILKLYRSVTPQLRSPDEHPFLLDDFRLIASTFKQVQIDFYSYTAPLVVCVPRFLRKPCFRVAWTIDRAIAHVPWIKYLAWVALVRGNC